MFIVLEGFTNFYFLKFIKVLHILTVPNSSLLNCFDNIIGLFFGKFKLSHVFIQVLYGTVPSAPIIIGTTENL